MDIQKYIRSLGKNNGSKMISLTKKLYKLMEKDTIYTDESKPFVAFATIARAYCYSKKEMKK